MPVRIWLHFHGLPPEGMARAGMTALAELTMIEGNPLPTYACRGTAVDGFLHGSFFERREYREEADALLECWRYDPCLFAPGGSGIVDRFSLYLSLDDSDDERVRLACAELLEGWTSPKNRSLLLSGREVAGQCTQDASDGYELST